MLTQYCIVCDEPINDLTEAREIDTDIGEGGVEYICAVCCETDPAAEVFSQPFGSLGYEMQVVRGPERTATFADGDDNAEPW